ncbi:MAG: S1 RNA-binding domain-containing protein [Chloroflexi bacterium]|nr:S1 RNA-binding domain-containing protein [Chloroflexota bacterium]
MSRDVSANAPGEPNPEAMEQLLEDDNHLHRSLRRGNILKGVVVKVDRDAVLVDVGLKSEGVIPSQEMQSLGPVPVSRVQIGDEILAYVLRPENEEGQVVLSLDRARGEKGWHTLERCLEKGESLEVKVTGFNRGGLLADIDGVRGFVPASQLGLSAHPKTEGDEHLVAMVGETLWVKVIELDRRQNRVILSARAAYEERRNEQRERILAELKEGEILRGRVSGISNFGIFVDLGGVDGLVHLSELSWERGRAPQELYKIGDEVEVYVLKVDPQTKRIALSLRLAQTEPWDRLMERYEEGQLVTGTITKLVSFGAFARVEGHVEGLIHISELADRRVVHPREVIKEGDVLPLKILRIERERHRLALSLRQAQGEDRPDLQANLTPAENPPGEAAAGGEHVRTI